MSRHNPITVSNEVSNQATTATLRIPGTDLELEYDSTRVFGDARDRTLVVPTDVPVIPELRRIEIEIDVAGQHHSASVSPGTESYEHIWDGRDAQGRRVQGSVDATVRVEAVYDGVYGEPTSTGNVSGGSGTGSSSGGSGGGGSFGRLPAGSITGSQTRETVSLSREYTKTLRSGETLSLGFGGWTANLHRGPHWQEERQVGVPVVEPIVDSGEGITSVGSFADTNFPSSHKAFGPDGTLYVIDYAEPNSDTGSIWAFDRDLALSGTISIPDDVIGSPGGDQTYWETIRDHPDTSRVIEGISFRGIVDMAVGPEGMIYWTSQQENAVYRGDPDSGTVMKVAGSGEASEAPIANDELGAATTTDIDPQYVAVGPEGSVYFAETEALDSDVGGTVRRITPNGQIEPVAGAPQIEWPPETGRELPDVGESYDVEAATDTKIYPKDLAVDDEGTVFFADALRHRGLADARVLLSVESDGKLRLVAGDPSRASNGRVRDGTAFQDIAFSTRGIANVEVGPNGDLFVTDQLWLVAYRLSLSTESIKTVLGNGERVGQTDWATGDVATSKKWPHTFEKNIAVAPDGTLVVDGRDPVWTLTRVGAQATERASPSPDGRMAHRIPDGRHEETIDSITGSTRQKLEYDEQGRVVAFVDAYGNRTAVERDDEGTVIIEAPGGQQTTLETGATGYTSVVTLPDDRTAEFEYTEGGLLTRVEDPEGNATTFSYDESGRVTGRTEPTGATTDFVHSSLEGGVETTRISPEMREVTDRREWEDGNRKLTRSCCGGTSSGTVITPSMESRVTRPDDGSRTVSRGPDPRFGMFAPVTERVVEKSPGGRTSTTESERTVSLADPIDPLSVETHTETVTINGRPFERAYDAAQNRFRISTPEGRITDVVLNENGDPTQVSADDIEPISLVRDGDGRITGIEQSDASITMTYADGYLADVTGADGATSTFTRDAVGRLTELSTPSGATHEFEYDDNDNLTRFTRPNGDVHAFSYTATGGLSVYSAPFGGTESVAFDDDGIPTELTRSSDRTLTNSHDSGGRLVEASYPEATVSRTRDGADRVTDLTRTPDGDGGSQTISYGRDGRAVTDISFAGDASGTFQYTHDADGFVTEITYPDGTSYSLSHDDDGLLTQFDSVSYTREGPFGKPTEITDGSLTITLTYDGRGRVATRSHTVNGTTIYDASFSYDAADRLIERTETVEDSTRTESFTYSADSDLTTVSRDGIPVEEYTYSANGNRTEAERDGTLENATYDAGDRLSARGGTNYDYDDDGFLTERGSDTFTYSTTGELLEATPESGEPITYSYDGYGRRVGRSDGPGTTEYLYGDPSNPGRATAVRGPDGTWTHYHYDPFGCVIAFDRGGDRYYVATDRIGTPRIVTAADGTVVKKLEHDNFGVRQTDTAPGFTLHVGFAGGIPDSATGLVRFGQRDYEPVAGRWTARDPLLLSGGQSNFYVYARNDPINFVDRNGLDCHDFWDTYRESYNQTMDSPIDEIVGAAAGGVWSAALGKELGYIPGMGNMTSSIAAGATWEAAGGASFWGATGAGLSAGALTASFTGGVAAGSALDAQVEEVTGRSLSDRVAEKLYEYDPLGLRYTDSDRFARED